MENSRDKNGLKEQNNSNEPTHTQGHNGDVPPLYTASVLSAPSSSSTSANKKDKINRIDNVFVNFCAKPNKKLKNEQKIDDYCLNSFKKYCTLALIVVFLLSLFASLVAFHKIWFTDSFNESIVENLALRNDTKSLSWWIKPPIEPLLQIHIFNYTNIDRFLQGKDDKIKLQDVGPYVYREQGEKVNLVFHDDHKITYSENTTQHFDKILSGGLSEEDILNLPNVPLIAALSEAIKMNFLKQMGFNTVILGSSAPKEFQKLSVKDYMFGYTDNFMRTIQTYEEGFDPKKSGLLSARRGVSTDNFTVFTGVDNLENLGMFYALNGEENTNNWKTDECNKVDGSTGSQFQPHMVDKVKDLKIYIKSFCRSFPLRYEKDVTVLNGIPAWKYTAPHGVFASANTNPDNECYCLQSNSKDCDVDGVFDISSCIGGVPMVISYPHFYEGDPSLSEMFEGLNPVQKDHETFAYIHPRLAFPIGGATRFQFNIRVKTHNGYYSKLKDIILPLCWLDFTSGEIPEELKKMIYHTTFSANAMHLTLQYGSLFALIASATFLFLSIYCYMCRMNKKCEDTCPNNDVVVTLNIKDKSEFNTAFE
ncbi:unnamed protein product [Diamesa hyperborea]